MTINLDIHPAGQHIRLKITSNVCVSIASFSNMRLTWAAQRKHFFAWTLAQLSGELSWVLVTQYRLENERLCSVQSYRLLKIYTSITVGLHFCSWAMGEQSAQDPKKTDFLINFWTRYVQTCYSVESNEKLRFLARSWSQSLTPQLLLSLQLFCKATTLHLCVHVINWPVAIDNIFLKRLDQSDPINIYNCPITFQIIQNE